MLDVMIMYSINTGTSSFRLLDRPPTDALLAGLLTGCDLAATCRPLCGLYVLFFSVEI